MTSLTEYSHYLSYYVSTHNKFKITKFKNKQLYIPSIGYIDPNMYYSLNKNIFNKSRLYIGNNKFKKISNNSYIRFEGTVKFYTNKWFINTIKRIINNYTRVFGEINPIYIQIKQKKNEKGNNFGGITSVNGVEIILHNYDIIDKYRLKWLLAHELFHLYSPQLKCIKYKYYNCWNEGLVDYLSLYYNFTDIQMERLINDKIKAFENIDKIKNEHYYIHKRSYITGLRVGHNLTQPKFNKIINYIIKYVKNRKYILEQIDDIKFVKEMGFYTKDCIGVTHS